MPLAYLLDENLRGPLYRHILRHNARRDLPSDVVRVGDPPDLPRGSEDPDILRWAEREGKDSHLARFEDSSTPSR